ncbi:ESAT-6-like protein EsxC [Mycolicibacterium anyangense]|jgi:WXG100 family type VII secretion target|uniref:ESAT-6-like protein EsxC n=1 Tax=Mycolicibacterium anyangense TaxID=1431246 RepID=A0A6N4WDI5_9MYCO|nr:WXG100 family type VII secretion target [Mycolicibacterium anyangense]BBZ78835.1 ESAT-6-like protein EsxC [Mycolicibacterium anyangense]
MSDNITYNHGGVADFASEVGSRSAQLMEIHDDIQQRTNAIADFFQGSAATSFHEAQMQMLQGLQGLIETMNQHGSTISSVNDSAHQTDLMMGNLF